MKVVGLTEFGGPEVLHTFEVPTVPEPGTGEVRIRVFAATVNPADFYLRDGRSAGAVAGFRPPFVPGVEVSGIIDALGAGSEERFQLGDRVTAHVMPLTRRGGGYAEEVVTLARWAVRAPAGSTFVEAATLPMNGMTALDAIEKAGAKPGATIAVVGAAGAVGGNAIQLAKAAGARVIADARPEDRDLVTRLGADVIVDRGPGLSERLLAEQPAGVDGIVDAVGYGGSLIEAIRDGGAFSFVAGGPSSAEQSAAAARSIRILPVNVTSVPDSVRMLEQLRGLVEDGRLTLRVQEVFRPEDAARAHALLMAGGTRGRLVLEFRAEGAGRS